MAYTTKRRLCCCDGCRRAQDALNTPDVLHPSFLREVLFFFKWRVLERCWNVVFLKACVVQCRLEKLAYTIQFDEGVEREVGNTDVDCGLW